jgi:hypothetical protein
MKFTKQKVACKYDYGKNITKASAMEARTKADGKTPIRDDCPTPDNGTTKKIFKVKRV